MADVEIISAKINERFGSLIENSMISMGELTIVLASEHLREVCLALRDESVFDFKCLVDVCGVDYLQYGLSEWETQSATERGFSRGVDDSLFNHPPKIKHRFASVYHLLSLTQNHRIRLRVFIDESQLKIPTVVDIWPSANWFEREAFDLFGIIYEGHPDLRRILTDYGFVGHPFRKDFPLIGNVEARYDAKEKRVLYEPVSIEPRVLEPKVIRFADRYEPGG